MASHFPDCPSASNSLQADSLAAGSSMASMLSASSDAEVDFSEIELGPRIGIGCFGEVFKARWRRTTVAVKRLIDQSLSQQSLKVTCLHIAGEEMCVVLPCMIGRTVETGRLTTAGIRHTTASLMSWC